MGILILIQKPTKTKTGSLKEQTLALLEHDMNPTHPIPTADSFELKKRHTISPGF